LFDFLDSDWFNISLEIVFLILISYDVKKYVETKKKEYITNIVFTIGFAIWTLYPYYNSYFGWNEKQKLEMISTCDTEVNQTLCKCLDDQTFKKYIYEEYKTLDKDSTDYKDFLKDSTDDCLSDSWFS